MKVLSAAALAVLLFSPQALAGGPEDFSGPFAGWRSVKADYGAAGDGVRDDTASIQRALDDLKKHEGFCVLYFPAGEYRVTSGLKMTRDSHTEGMGITLVGEDPARTVLRWDGPKGGSMLQCSVWYSKISRLTLDGRGSAGACLVYGPKFSTYNETSDMVFKDAEKGLWFGAKPGGQAENAVLRCRFERLSDGVLTSDFNSMDIWVWYGRFEDCGYGLRNGAGNFHAYRNLFLRSTKADARTENLMTFTFEGNVSIGSACFIDFSGSHSWGSPTSITHNRVIRDRPGPAVKLGNGGPYLVADNAFRSAPGDSGPAIELTWGDQVLVGNAYSSPNPVGGSTKGRVLRIDDGPGVSGPISDSLPEMPPVPPKSGRRVFEVAPAAGAADIQAAIDRAAAEKGKTVVHLPKGVYKIDRTLVVPARADIEISGDGGAETATVLAWAGEPLGLVFRLLGPSRASLRDFMIQAPAAGGVVVEGADQPGGRIYANQLNVIGAAADSRAASGLWVRGVESSEVELDNMQGGHDTKSWVRVTGGPKLRAGEDASGRVSLFCGATGSAGNFYSVARGGRLVSRSVYHELSSQEVGPAVSLDDSGSLSVDATRFSCKTADSPALFEANGFDGAFFVASSIFTPVGSTVTARMALRGDGSKTRFLALADLFWVWDAKDTDPSKLFRDASSPPAEAGMALCNMNMSGEKTYAILPARGRSGEDFVRRMAAPLRAAVPAFPSGAPEGVTDVRIHRIICSTGKNTIGVELRGE